MANVVGFGGMNQMNPYIDRALRMSEEQRATMMALAQQGAEQRGNVAAAKIHEQGASERARMAMQGHTQDLQWSAQMQTRDNEFQQRMQTLTHNFELARQQNDINMQTAIATGNRDLLRDVMNQRNRIDQGQLQLDKAKTAITLTVARAGVEEMRHARRAGGPNAPSAAQVTEAEAALKRGQDTSFAGITQTVQSRDEEAKISAAAIDDSMRVLDAQARTSGRTAADPSLAFEMTHGATPDDLIAKHGWLTPQEIADAKIYAAMREAGKNFAGPAPDATRMGQLQAAFNKRQGFMVALDRKAQQMKATTAYKQADVDRQISKVNNSSVRIASNVSTAIGSLGLDPLLDVTQSGNRMHIPSAAASTPEAVAASQELQTAYDSFSQMAKAEAAKGALLSGTASSTAFMSHVQASEAAGKTPAQTLRGIVETTFKHPDVQSVGGLPAKHISEMLNIPWSGDEAVNATTASAYDWNNRKYKEPIPQATQTPATGIPDGLFGHIDANAPTEWNPDDDFNKINEELNAPIESLGTSD
jgi:hypothetical protein